MSDYLIAGLGNPGSEHADQRHNVGFWCVNRLARKHGIVMKHASLADTGKGLIAEADCILVKPRTFMNRSGQAVAPLIKREGVPIDHVIVVYDDLDLPEGRLRIRPKGGSGGHNGIKSIAADAGSPDFGRIRLGIGRPLHQGVPSWDSEVVMRHVLSAPPKTGRELIDAAIERAIEAIECVIREGWIVAMDRYNRQEPA